MDMWYPKGRLIELTGELGTQKLGIARNARIYDVLVGGEWRIRVCRDQQLQRLVQEIHRFHVSVNVIDEFLWKHGQMNMEIGLNRQIHGN